MSNTSRLLTFVKENWTWVAPLLYAYATLIGLVSSSRRFQEYGINVLDFAELNDFMLAAFRDPVMLLASIFVGVAFYLYTIFLEWVDHVFAQRRARQRLRSVRFRTRLKSYVFGAVFLPFLGKDGTKKKYKWSHRHSLRARQKLHMMIEKFNRLFYRAARLLIVVAIVVAPIIVVNVHKPLPSVDVHLRSYPEGKSQVDYAGLFYIGTTEKFVFFYRNSSKSTITVPIANLGSISSIPLFSAEVTIEISDEPTNSANQ